MSSRGASVKTRWLNYTLNDAWLWQYSRQHYEKKFGTAVFWELKQSKGTPAWDERRRQFDVLQVAALDAGKKPKERRSH